MGFQKLRNLKYNTWWIDWNNLILPLLYLRCVLFMFAHPNMKSLHTSQRQKAIKGRRNSSNTYTKVSLLKIYSFHYGPAYYFGGTLSRHINPSCLLLAHLRQTGLVFGYESKSRSIPITTSECPLINLVIECMTMSAPKSNGFYWYKLLRM